MMVIFGGIATSVLLIMIVWVAWVYRYRELPKSLTPSRLYDVFFWLSIVSILTVSGYGLWQVL